MMRRMKLWVVIGLLAAAIPVQAQQDENKQKACGRECGGRANGAEKAGDG